MQKHLPKVIVFLFGFLLYANTLNFDFALDDKIVISYNSFTKKGTSGIQEIFENESFTGFFGKKKNLVEGGRYRPLTIAYFAVVWEFLGPKEGASAKMQAQKTKQVAHFLHVNNAVFYGLTGILLYMCLCSLFSVSGHRWYESFAFVASMLYLAHPIHTEVVANIKGLDEIWAFMGGLLSLYFVLKYLEHQKILFLGLSFVGFLFGVFSKESVVVFLGVIPLTVWIFKSVNISKLLRVSIPAFLAFVVYFIARTKVLGDVDTSGQQQLLNQPFLYASGVQKIATILLTMFLYVKLCVFPHPLTHDYYPWHPVGDDTYRWDPNHYPYAELNNPLVWLSLLLYVGMLGYGVRYLWYQKGEKVVAYGFLFFIGTFILFSNLFFEIGVFMNERFMYVPSLGLVLVLVHLMFKYVQPTLRMGVFIAVLALFSFKTMHRNTAWENDETLALADYETSSASAKVNMSAGGAYYELARKEKNAGKKANMLRKSVQLLEKSLTLYPQYIQSKTLLGHANYEAGNYEASIKAYQSGLSQNPEFMDIENAIFIIADTLVRAKKAPVAAQYLEMLLSIKPSSAKGHDRLGQVYGKEMGQLDKSLPHLLKAHELDPKTVHTIENIGVAYGMKGNFKESLNYFLKALALEPNKKNLLENIGKTYYYLGDIPNSNAYMLKAKSLK